MTHLAAHKYWGLAQFRADGAKKAGSRCRRQQKLDCSSLAAKLLPAKPLPPETAEQVTLYLGDVVLMKQRGKLHRCMEKAIKKSKKVIPGVFGPEARTDFCHFVDDIGRWRMKNAVKAQARVDRQSLVNSRGKKQSSNFSTCKPTRARRS